MKPEKKIIQLLLRIRLFREFSAAELVEMFSQLSPELRRLDLGEVLVRTDDPAQQVGMVVSGLLTLCRSGESSRVHDLSQCAADDVFGLTALFSGPGKSTVTITAAVDTEVLLFDIRSLLADDRYKDRLKDAALRIIADHSMRNILKIDVLLSPTMRERIMTYFGTMRDQHGSDTFQIKPTQTELADYLGVNRSALSRELNRMQREGILKLLPNRRYHIMKWKTDLPDTRQETAKADQVNTDKRELR